ncbi:MAG: hypothetical protein C4581_03615 [Nitrospiraceae bacterium]|nr:MAG: hypothetical protein C4581_03615 [Nitrospiraceae bacterium]
MKSFPDTTFTGVHVYKKNHVYISGVSDELAEQNIDHAVILRWFEGKWAHKTVNVAIRGMSALEGDKVTLLNMGIDGKIIEFTFPGEHVEHVDTSDSGPSDLLHLRCMSKIDNHIFVAGMARRVYRRDGVNQWTAIDQGVFVPRDTRKEAVGFNAIDGLMDNSIYAVGYKGEIWHFNGEKWEKNESPTNVVLNGVKCRSDGEVYACGMAGLILKGSNGSWLSIDQDLTRNDFWGITEFQGRIYLSNYDGLFTVHDDTLEPVNFGFNKKLSTAYIHSSDNALWSVGQKDLAYTIDGTTWLEVEKP